MKITIIIIALGFLFTFIVAKTLGEITNIDEDDFTGIDGDDMMNK